MSDKNYFSEEYSPESTTEDLVTGKNKDMQESECKEDFKIEQDKYGDAKPKRIIIKAKLIDG